MKKNTNYREGWETGYQAGLNRSYQFLRTEVGASETVRDIVEKFLAMEKQARREMKKSLAQAEMKP